MSVPFQVKKSLVKAKMEGSTFIRMESTASSIGSHVRTDLDSYLNLIRAKIQQKCGTTRELLYHIKRTKIGNQSKITPSEFRFILIKFGIMLSQHIVDKIFNIFDSDRSGTMDYDEFGMWIMNQEAGGPRAVADIVEDKENDFRRRMLAIITNKAGLFSRVNRYLSYLEFISFMNFASQPFITEKESRTLFMLLNHNAQDAVMDMIALQQWAQGSEYTPIHPKANRKIPTLAEALKKEFGINRGIILHCFKAYIGQGKILISFDEFRKCLLSQGHGLDINAARDLFAALGGAVTGYVDTSLILETVEGAPILKSNFNDRPRTVNRVNELLREAMRKCCRELHKEFRSADTEETGFLTNEQMHEIINRLCLPLTHQDFRGVLKQLKADESVNKVNWHTFLMQYSPHKLQSFLPSPTPFPQQRPQTTDGVMKHAFTNTNNSTLFKATNTLLKNSSTVAEGNESAAGLGDTKVIKHELPSTQNSNNTNNNKDDAVTDSTQIEELPGAAAMRSLWQGALNRCRVYDVDRIGSISSSEFLKVLLECDPQQKLSEEDRSHLTNKFAVGRDKVDYVSCFRMYLSGYAAKASAFKQQDSLSSSTDTFKGYNHSRRRGTMSRHPWEFDYNREAHPFNPYIPSSDAKLTVLDHTRAKMFPLRTAPREVENIAELLDTYGAKVLAVCKKCADTLPLLDVKYLEHEFRSCEGRAMRTGVITPLSFQSVLRAYCKMLTTSEMGAILRGFRVVLDQAEEVNYLAFLRVCAAMKSAAP